MKRTDNQQIEYHKAKIARILKKQAERKRKADYQRRCQLGGAIFTALGLKSSDFSDKIFTKEELESITDAMLRNGGLAGLRAAIENTESFVGKKSAFQRCCDDESHVACFIEDVLEKSPTDKIFEKQTATGEYELENIVSSGELYRKLYLSWCEAHGVKSPLGRNRFINEIFRGYRNKGFYRQKFVKTEHITTSRKSVFVGYHLKEGA